MFESGVTIVKPLKMGLGDETTVKRISVVRRQEHLVRGTRFVKSQRLNL